MQTIITKSRTLLSGSVHVSVWASEEPQGGYPERAGRWWIGGIDISPTGEVRIMGSDEVTDYCAALGSIIRRAGIMEHRLAA